MFGDPEISLLLHAGLFVPAPATPGAPGVTGFAPMRQASSPLSPARPAANRNRRPTDHAPPQARRERPSWIRDFDPDRDRLFIIHDAGGPAPRITLAPTPHAKDLIISADGIPLARIGGGAGLTVADIRLLARRP